MKIRSWHILLLGLATTAGGFLSAGFSVVPYAPAVKAGFPNAKAVAVNGPWPVLAILAGGVASLIALAFWLQKMIWLVRAKKHPVGT